MKDPRERFSETVEAYRKNRPSYPPAIFRWIAATTGVRRGDRVADVGCGTGISTRLLAKRGWRVVGVDPNPAMLRAARRDGGASYRRGEGAKTGLGAGSVRLVTAFQAFHWFTQGPTLREWRRILAPRGWCVLVWNVRKRTPILSAYDALLRTHSTEYRVSNRPDTIPKLRARRVVRDWREASFPNRQFHDRKGLFGRAYSSSYVVHGVADHESLDRGLGALFRRFARGGRVRFDYETRAYAFRISPSP